MVIAAIAVIRAVWLRYAGGLKYVLLSALLHAPGVLLFAKAKREVAQPIFTHMEKQPLIESNVRRHKEETP
jgi:arginine:ornithine antiporter/lysine permease